MAYHSFSLDPRTILGVGPRASLDEIHEAYRSKSKKYHPDAGGDEWVFRMVTRAYEVLTTTTAFNSADAETAYAADVAQRARRDSITDWSGIWNSRFTKTESSSASKTDEAKSATGTREQHPPWEHDENASATASGESQFAITEPDELRYVDVELIWTRFEKEGSGRLLSTQEGDDATLSVCLVVSWPPHELVHRAADFASAGEILRALIDLFENVRGQNSIVAARSRIEDGRFVGWLSFVDVLTAQDTFLLLRDTSQSHRLSVKLHTRDERVPIDWYEASDEPVMAYAS
jgi:hypothetical protein